LEASKADIEDARFEGYNDAIALTGMVAWHMASMPPPPPLPTHAPLLAAYGHSAFRAANVAMTTRRGWS
jgi:hypothetical protein